MIKAPQQAVILCGGLGTRLKPYTNQNPKPMVICNGKPFLWYLLQQLHEQDITKFLLLTGYLGEKIKNYFGDGSSFGWEIQYSSGPVTWDTGKRVWEAKEYIEKYFVLLYSDNFAPFPMEKVLKIHNKNNLPLTFMVTKKIPGNVHINELGIVQNYNNNRLDRESTYVEIGYMIIEKASMLSFFDMPECNLSSVIRSMAQKKLIGAWVQRDSYQSISDPERWKKTENYLEDKKIIFIDRDGVINHKAPKGEYITNWDDFKIISDTFEVMKSLSKIGFKFIIITNQAGIARKKIKPAELTKIHKNLIKKCCENEIEILKIYVCPHHWDEECECRKPKPGMFYKASDDFQIRLDKTLFIGDDVRDCKAAYNAGLKSIFFGDTADLMDLEDIQQPIFSTKKLSINLSKILDYFSLQ